MILLTQCNVEVAAKKKKNQNRPAEGLTRSSLTNSKRKEMLVDMALREIVRDL